MACAPPMRKMRSAPDRWQPAIIALWALGGRQAMTSSTPATLAGTMVMIGADSSGIAAARHVAADALDRDDAVAEMDAGQRLDLERQDGRELRLGEAADVGDGELGVGAGLRVELGEGGLALRGASPRRPCESELVEAARVVAHRRVALVADPRDDLGHGAPRPRPNRPAPRARAA